MEGTTGAVDPISGVVGIIVVAVDAAVALKIVVVDHGTKKKKLIGDGCTTITYKFFIY